MKKISYYVAAFALCCGVSQTLTSCIEETEEPDDVKAMRQAEIAKINADAEYVKAQAASQNATAALTNAEVDAQKIDNAIKELQKALREGTQADSIAYYAAAVQSAIKKMKNTDITQAKELAVALLPAKLNASCPSYDAMQKAYTDLYGGTVMLASGSTYNVAVASAKKTILDNATAALDNGVNELLLQLNYLAELQTNVAAKELALKNTKKQQSDWKKLYDDESTSCPAAAADFKSLSGTFDASDKDIKADEKAKVDIVFTYLITLAENDLAKAQQELKLAEENKSFESTKAYKNLFEAKETAQKEYDAKLAAYEEAKAKYEEELAALKAIN
jgi:hypothetical protein